MELDFAFLADAATIDAGKLNVIGGSIDTLWAKKTPVVHPYMTLVIKFILAADEVEKSHKLEVFAMDSDGKRVFSTAGEFIPSRVQSLETWKPQGHLMAMNLINTRFEKFGDYSIEIVVDGLSVKSLPLRITEQIEEGALH